MTGPRSSAIVVLNDLLSTDECAAWIRRGEAAGFVLQAYGVRPEGQPAPEVRRRAAADDPTSAASLWARLAPRLPPLAQFYPPPLTPDPPVDGGIERWSPIGLNTRLRYYRYSGRERFKPHCDLAHEVTEFERSFLTVIVFLNDGFEGGETRFEHVTIRPVRGSALVFAHEHRHEGLPVSTGEKTVLRTDVVFRRQT